MFIRSDTFTSFFALLELLIHIPHPGGFPVIVKLRPLEESAPATSIRRIPYMTHPHISPSRLPLPLHAPQYGGHPASTSLATTFLTRNSLATPKLKLPITARGPR